ncbi:hypothetical protein T03_344 [Trichinella britovi]|uniref:Uncharacterized protein n=1 Tax=Trichinella britovi TaxID=45882 RepID=A0A0V1AU83_TRIBR|nr:hypothetical protein T03_344 [Trichinella britovi]
MLMYRPPYVSFHPEISTAEDVRVWSGFPTVAYNILPVSRIWLQSWLGAFADIFSEQFLHSWYRELLSPRLGRRSSSREMSHYRAAVSSSMRRS